MTVLPRGDDPPIPPEPPVGGQSRWPSVGVVQPTRDRPAELKAALDSVLAQDYQGRVEAVVVHDRSQPDQVLAGDRVRVLGNARTPGLAGARNTGILALDTDLVAFCDDDDDWLPGKLTAQVNALQARPGAEFASCGILVDSGGRLSPRLAGQDEVGHADLLRSRMVMVHSSTFLARRDALLDGIGLLEESIPGSQNEDWDLALRAARRAPIAEVDEALVRVRWSGTSYFDQQWETKAESLIWMLERHPELTACRVGAARVYGQLAFAYACLGRRREAARWGARALRGNWHERRVVVAAVVATGLVPGETILRLLHARGHGI
jgi:glycosyltransferase involved in cell wall biosynthesis